MLIKMHGGNVDLLLQNIVCGECFGSNWKCTQVERKKVMVGNHSVWLWNSQGHFIINLCWVCDTMISRSSLMIVFVLNYFGGIFQQKLINPKH
jgi:hypothetical protein